MDLFFNLEKMAVLVCAVLMSVGSAVIVIIAIAYLLIRAIDLDLSKSANATYNHRLLGSYAPALELIMLKLTSLSQLEIKDVVSEAISKGYVDLRLDNGLIKINNKTLVVEPSQNEPEALAGIDGILKTLNDSSGRLAYWLTLQVNAKQYIQQSALDFFQHINGICYTHLNEHKSFRLTVDRYGMVVTKHDAQQNELSRHVLKIVDMRPELKVEDEECELKPAIRKWEMA